MEAAAAESVYDACHAAAIGGASDGELMPATDWQACQPLPLKAKRSLGKRLPGGGRAVEILVGIGDGDSLQSALSSSGGFALRADSPDAPSTHAEAMRRGMVWVRAESTELGNHATNQSWVLITSDELPRGRRVHKLIWVYKVKRDGTAKARLCVQGSTLQSGIDYDQAFSAALRYSSARALFAFAAANGCKVRSVDLVAAYLQGEFIDGEVVYCHMPPGHAQYDSKGRPLIAKVQKPIYGIQQAGRRLQRLLFAWMLEQGFRSLDDSDPCIFTREFSDGEILTVGIYVDNLQIVHSAKLDTKGRGPDGCAYNEFMDAVQNRWKVTDEGPMEDLLGIEVEYNSDGSIKLHQSTYIRKVVERFMPDGPGNRVQKNSVPFSKDLRQNLLDALSQPVGSHPELVQPFQQVVGCLMYAATSSRPDVAYVTHQLCKCLQKPTPALMEETRHVLSYLARNASVGLTFSAKQCRLAGFSDASWEVKHSTSGWTVLWGNAALVWGSRKQKSIALSTCEAELIALSEATKDMVYLRKLLAGLGPSSREPGPSTLATDSKSARDVSYNPQHHDRMKHVQRRHFFVRDMVESFEIEVPYVPTDDNIADFFTKPLEPKKFHAMRRVIMNEPVCDDDSHA